MKASAVLLPNYALVRKVARQTTVTLEYYGFVAAGSGCHKARAS